MAALPSGTPVEVIDRRIRRHPVGVLKEVKTTGVRASNRYRYGVYIGDLIKEHFKSPPDRFDHWGKLLMCAFESYPTNLVF